MARPAGHCRLPRDRALFSTNRRRIPWKVVGIGMVLQIAIGWLVLYAPPVRYIFEAAGAFFVTLLSFTNEGSPSSSAG